MNIVKDEVWAIIPARGGSKSIPLKNLVELNGIPLITYVINAAKASKRVTRIICSTDDKRIADYCTKHGVEVHLRPDNLAMDDSSLLDVLMYTLQDIHKNEEKLADVIPILQPTSPFLLPEHIDECVLLLSDNEDAQSSQTITSFPHVLHAYNQRLIDDRYVKFVFAEERRLYYNKQRKPDFYIYGNLVVTRSKTLLIEREIFGDKSIPFFIPYPYALDLDRLDDLETAEWYLEKGKVSLSFNNKIIK